MSAKPFPIPEPPSNYDPDLNYTDGYTDGYTDCAKKARKVCKQMASMILELQEELTTLEGKNEH